MEGENRYHVSSPSCGRSLRAVVSAVGRWSSSFFANLFWRSVALGLSQSLMQASSLRGRLFQFQESLDQLRVRSKDHSEESCVFFAVIFVFAGSTSASVRMHPTTASRSQFVKDVDSWLRRLVGSRTRLKSISQVHPS